MSIITISVILAILMALTFITFCADVSTYDNPRKGCLFFFMCSLVIGSWIIAANQIPWKLYDKSDLQISTDSISGAQVVGYETPEGEYKVVNLNRLFERSLSNNMTIRVIQFKTGPYLWIYFLPHTQYLLMINDKVIDTSFGENIPKHQRNY